MIASFDLVDQELVAKVYTNVPLDDLYDKLAANDFGLAEEILARTATDVEVAEVRVIAEAAITQAQLDATVIEVAGSSDAGLNALDAALSADISAEAVARAAADSAEVTARTAAVAAEASARIAGIAAEATLRAAAVTAETNARNTQVNAEALARAEVDDEIYVALAAQGDAVYAAIEAGDIAEGNARDTAIGVGLNALSVELTEDIDLKGDRYVEGLTDSLVRRGQVVAHRARRDLVGFEGTAGTTDLWVIGYLPEENHAGFDDLSVFPADFGAAHHFNVQVVTRPIAEIASATFPGLGSNDVVLGNGSFLIRSGDLYDRFLPETAAHEFRIRLGDIVGLPPVKAGAFLYMILIYGETSGNTPAPFSLAQGQPAGGGEANWRRGWLRTVDYAGPLPGTDTISYYLRKSVGEDVATALAVPVAPKTATRTDGVVYGATPADGINIPASTVRHAGGEVAVRGGLVTFPIPTGVTITDEVFTMRHDQASNLVYQFLENYSAKREDNNAPLTEGVHYSIDLETGKLISLTTTYDILQSYTGLPQRYSTVYADPVTGAIDVAHGTARKNDALEYKPALPAQQVPLFEVLVSKNVIDAVDVRKWNGFAAVGHEWELDRWINEAPCKLPKLFGRLRNRLPIIVATSGDSNPTMGGVAEADWYTPGGTGRDHVSYFYENRNNADTMAAIQWYDAAGNPDPGGNYHHEGRNWRLIEAWEAWGCVVNNKTLSIGGCTSDIGIVNGVPGLASALRIAAVDATGAHVAIYCIGLNEQGSSNTYGNMKFIIDHDLSVGREVILWGMAQTARNGGDPIYAKWRETQRQLQAVADSYPTGVMFIPTDKICGLENLGAMGLSWRSLGQVDGRHHPGIYENRVLGRFGALPFGGQTGQIVGPNAISPAVTLSKRSITGTTGTITAADAGLVIECLNGSPTTITVPNDQVEGFHCRVRQVGGAITFTAGSGATLRSLSGAFVTSGQWSEVELSVRGNSTGVVADWVLTGDI